MEVLKRRALLKTQNNPNKQRDYIITLETVSPDGKVRLSVRYIPDKITLHSDCFESYMTCLFSAPPTSLEETTTQLVEDMSNELVPRWIQVIAFADKGKAGQHSVIMEDKQPNWENPHLMARLATI